MKKTFFMVLLMAPIITSAQLADSAQRLVHLQGAINFRDIGGYTTQEGTTVKWNKIFRSAAINKLTDEDMQVIRGKHIHTVIDFRGTKEAAIAPDRLLPNTEYILSPAGSDSLPSQAEMAILLQQGGFLDKMYGKASIRYFADRYRPMFHKLLVLEDQDALLYHCTGGRDRTGMATALVLYILGVPQQKIEEDFTASNIYLEPMMGKMFGPMMKATGLSEADIRKEMQLRPALIRTFFQAIKEQFGSVEQFLDKEMGIGKKEILVLKKKYTA